MEVPFTEEEMDARLAQMLRSKMRIRSMPFAAAAKPLALSPALNYQLLSV